MGCTMEFHLFKNMTVEEVVRVYKPIKGGTPDVPKPLKPKEIRLHPGVNLRKRGVHQKGIVEYPGRPRLDTNKPLVLAVVCQNRWIRKEEYRQDYAVVVTVEHSANIDLFNRIQTKNKARVRVTLRGT